MKAFPMFLRMQGRRVVIVGGGEQAAQKARLMARTEAELVLVAPVLNAELAGLVGAGRARHDCGPLRAACLDGAALIFIASGDEVIDEAAHGLAIGSGVPVNVVDRPELCTALTPSIVDRDPVVVAIGTEGTAPVLGRRLRAEIEAMLDPALGPFAAMAGALRPRVAGAIPAPQRRAFWDWVFGGAPFRAFRRGEARRSEALILAALDRGGAEGAEASLTLIGGAEAPADLLTLRALGRLQEADLVIHSGATDSGLDLARRDAARLCLPAAACPEAVLEALAARRQVVWLYPAEAQESGLCDQVTARARASGVPVERLPAATEAVTVAQFHRTAKAPPRRTAALN